MVPMQKWNYLRLAWNASGKKMWWMQSKSVCMHKQVLLVLPSSIPVCQMQCGSLVHFFMANCHEMSGRKRGVSDSRDRSVPLILKFKATQAASKRTPGGALQKSKATPDVSHVWRWLQLGQSSKRKTKGSRGFGCSDPSEMLVLQHVRNLKRVEKGFSESRLRSTFLASTDTLFSIASDV